LLSLDEALQAHFPGEAPLDARQTKKQRNDFLCFSDRTVGDYFISAQHDESTAMSEDTKPV